MRILVATDSFKGTMTSAEAGAAIARGLRRACPQVEVEVLPLADGGEGTMAVLLAACGGHRRQVQVHGPRGDAVAAEFGLLKDGATAVVEMAEASGLLRVEPHRRDVLHASTFGTGELIRAALAEGADRVLIGVGGSATCDGGAGCLQALGVRMLDAGGRELPAGVGGGQLRGVCRIDAHALEPRWRQATAEVLCDVTNALLGPRGAAPVFAPQKGATPPQVAALEENLAHWAELLKRDLGVDVATRRHGGAAGGLAAGLAALGAHLQAGAERILEQTSFDGRAGRADAVITGEGRLDEQSLSGKLVSVVAGRARILGKPVFVLAGQVRLSSQEIGAHFADAAAVSTDEASEVRPADAALLLEQATAASARRWWPSIAAR